MNREIKFRAWDKETKRMMRVTRMDWPEWAICVGENDPKNMEEYYISERNSFKNEETDRFILMQFTGLKDKNGKEIYGEGDIYKDAFGIISVVKMAVDGWALFPINKGTPVRNLYWHNICDKTKGEVIGNVHDNPELLEQGK